MTIVTIQSNTPSFCRSLALYNGGLWYVFDTAASKRQFVRRLRRGCEFGPTVKWATGLGPDPLEPQEIQRTHVSPEPQEILTQEHSSIVVGTTMEDYYGGYATPWTDPSVWHTLLAFKQAGCKKPLFRFPRYRRNVWKRFVDIYWELLDYLPVDIDPMLALDYSVLQDYGWTIDDIIFLHQWKEIWCVKNGFTQDTEWLESVLSVFSKVRLGSKTTQEFLLYTWEEWAISVVEKDADADDLSLKDFVYTLDCIFKSEDAFIKESFETLFRFIYSMSRISIQKDTCESVQPRFYSYSTDVLELASNSKKRSLHKEKGLMLGVELEFSHSTSSLKELYSLTHMGVFKFDSSVDGEYVTLPYIPSEMVSRITKFSLVFDKLLSANGSEGNGMHVHVSRNGLASAQMLNLQVLLNPSSSEGQNYWSVVADRQLQNNRSCGFIDPQYLDPKCLYTDSRYVVLNYTNEHTVEFRMFKAPRTTDKVLWNLSIVQGLLEFSKNSNSLEEWMVSPLNPMNN